MSMSLSMRETCWDPLRLDPLGVLVLVSSFAFVAVGDRLLPWVAVDESAAVIFVRVMLARARDAAI
eukprot:CAMPEP_0194050828 /NCGR_PEP_ID=MMETSP0009_2-20130614/37294_1 /TAXON_ID=210454 /ORGANISM="Grammatophora oceanica, Strain CCMP 410" /LENGTH=65 /DNA_ID=CAMNT_0038697651 /DNA_START=8 /DNA_END=202 /DNA_ORIENTATION=+